MKSLFIIVSIFIISLSTQANPDLFFAQGTEVVPGEDGVYRLPPIGGGDMLDESTTTRRDEDANSDDDGVRELRNFNPCAFLNQRRMPKRHLEYRGIKPPSGHYREFMRRLPQAEIMQRRIPFEEDEEASFNSNRRGPERVFLAGGGEFESGGIGIGNNTEEMIELLREKYGCDEFLGASLSDQLRQSPTCANSLNTYCSGAEDADSCAIQHQHLLGDACYSSVGLRTDAEINGDGTQMVDAVDAVISTNPNREI